jgi:hypothetical protein
MGSPDHYGVELPTRCMKLLSELWPHAEKLFPDHGEELGPLTASFLLSLAMPIINLPIERIERQNGTRFDGYVDDRMLDEALAQRMKTTLGSKKVSSAPFFIEGVWAYHRSQQKQPINISDGFPDDIAEALLQQAAHEAASGLAGSQWSSILRNSLAHGGVAYLDEEGGTAQHRPAKYFVFVNGSFDRDECGRPIGLNAVHSLRVSTHDFKIFLNLWVRWLNDVDQDGYPCA